MANAEKPQEPPSVEIIPEQETEPGQGAQYNRPVNRPAVTRPRREKAPAFISEGLYVSLPVDLVLLLD